MKQITFLGSTSSNYLFGQGRGKDKKKRKQRRENALVGAGAGLLGGGLGAGLAFKGSPLTPKQRLLTAPIALAGATLAGAGLGSIIKKPLLSIKKRTSLTDAKDFVVGGRNFIKESNIKSPKDLIDIYQARKDTSFIATKAGVVGGLLLGTGQNVHREGVIKGLSGTTNKLNTLNTTLTGLSIGNDVDRQIHDAP